MSLGGIALTASGWIAAFFVGILDLPTKINSFATEAPKATKHLGDWIFLDKTLTGSWTSSQPEGEVIAKPTFPALDALDGALLHLEMTVYRGEAVGSIYSGGLEKRYIFSLVELEGRSSNGRIEAVAWDVVNGKKVNLAEFTLTPSEHSGEPVLEFKLVRQFTDYFPKKAILWATIYKPDGEFNSRFKRAVEEESKRAINNQTRK